MKQDTEQIDTLIDNFGTAMLITESLDGELRGRPMAIAGRERGSILYFLSCADDEKLEELLQRSSVAVVMQGSDQYLSISGVARLETNKVLIDKYWSAGARLWFPDGPGDTTVTLVVIEPTYAECWDRTGIRKLEFWWEAGRALLTGEKAADRSLGGHRKIRVRPPPSTASSD